MATLEFLEERKLYLRARTIKVVAAAAVAVAALWATFGLPIPATRTHVASEVGSVRLEALESRQDILELRSFLLDWTLRQSTLDPQARALIEVERQRTLERKTAIGARIEQARAARP